MDGINYGVSYAQSRVPHAPPTAPTAPAPGTWTSASVHEDFRAPVPRAVPIPRFAIRWMHEAGKCIPCRFFAFKEDGCQKGNACEFCHFCGQEAAVRQVAEWVRLGEVRLLDLGCLVFETYPCGCMKEPCMILYRYMTKSSQMLFIC
ncbi:unnamed protein product [Durusdinium trenchii]|uniref:C3H1-type domain-containing protein n=1 Tax=Durusdinium trenchii TaxID=1381693 RepID=A0ABP0NVV5_9DINO